ncbi:MAG TPA: hypothetical protein DD687_01415 [Verrucomicrobiales bacterium]|nr:hypothetical protein [Verrucomicrobiales bacterium]
MFAMKMTAFDDLNLTKTIFGVLNQRIPNDFREIIFSLKFLAISALCFGWQIVRRSANACVFKVSVASQVAYFLVSLLSICRDAKLARCSAVICLSLLFAGGAGCVSAHGNEETKLDRPQAETQLPQNFRSFGNEIYVGAEPDALSDFVALKQRGVATIVSVDGAKPNLQLARRFGMNYVHIPIGYDGVGEDQSRSLVRVAREAKRPIYVHCHHGRHRGPTAAALICLEDGAVTVNRALSLMNKSGTSKDYAGLWESISAFESPSDDVQLPVLFETYPLNDLVSTMAKMDRILDGLKQSEAIGWQTPQHDPDQNPAQMALLMREWFHELARNPQEGHALRMREQLHHAEKISRDLENALKVGNSNAITSSFGQLKQSCSQCHSSYRDQ